MTFDSEIAEVMSDRKPRKLWWATLVERSPRYATWRKILGSDDVPLVAPVSFRAWFGRDPKLFEGVRARCENTGH